MGSAVHAALQFHFEQLLAGNPPPDLGTLVEVYQQTWRQRHGKVIQFPKGETLDTFGRMAGRLLATFIQSDFARPSGIVLGVEEELRGEVVPGCPELLARLDLVVKTREYLEITDFKTARGSWSESHVNDAAPQLLLYSELARPLADGKPVRLRFAVLCKTRFPQLTFHQVRVDPIQVARTKRIVERVWKAIQAGNFYPSPSPITCSTCPFQTPCRDWTG